MDPLLRFFRFCQKKTKSQILKKAKKGSIFTKLSPKWKDWILRLYGSCMQKIRSQKPAKKLKGHFLYLPILLYNTMWIFQKSVVSLASRLNRNSEQADFWTQNVNTKKPWHRIRKNSKLKNVDLLLRNRRFCQKWLKS